MSGARTPAMRDLATGLVPVPLVPVSATDAASKAYADGLVPPVTTLADVTPAAGDESLVSGGTGPTLLVKDLIGGTSITLTSDADSITIDAAGGGFDPMTTAGDLVHRNAGNTTARLAVGASGSGLMVSAAGVPMWGAMSMGELYMENNATQTSHVGAGGAYVKVAGTTTLSGLVSDFDMPADNELRYTGAITKRFHIAVSISFTVMNNNKLVGYEVWKNNSARIPGSLIKRFVATGADVGSTAIHCFESLAQNDYLTLRVANNTDDVNTTTDTMNIFAMGML